MLECFGYHGTLMSNAASILKDGYKQSGEREWFGAGVYFFGDAQYFSGEREAMFWVLNVKGEENWAIFVAEIRSDKYFDMVNDHSDRAEFDRMRAELLKKHMSFGLLANKFTDQIVLKLLEKTNQFEVIRAFVEATKKPYIAYVMSRPQIQICVKNLEAIVSNKLVKTRTGNVN